MVLKWDNDITLVSERAGPPEKVAPGYMRTLREHVLSFFDRKPRLKCFKQTANMRGASEGAIFIPGRHNLASMADPAVINLL